MKFIRNKDKVQAAWSKNAAGQRVAKQPLRIHTPARFVEKGLSVIGVRTYVYGCFPIILNDDTYAVCNIPTRIEIAPDQTRMVTIDEIDYYEFFFDEGTIWMPSARAVQDDKIIYFIVDEIMFQGKVPWYMNYDDVGNILAHAKQYADFGGASIQEVPELMASIIARDKNDHEKFIRLSMASYKDVEAGNVQYVPMESVQLSVPGTINRLGGNYFEPAIEGALVQPSKSVDNVQRILRA